MQTLIANIKYAIRSNETVSIGGGEFTPKELQAFLDELGAATSAAPTAAQKINVAPTVSDEEMLERALALGYSSTQEMLQNQASTEHRQYIFNLEKQYQNTPQAQAMRDAFGLPSNTWVAFK